MITDMKDAKIFSPLQLGRTTLKNTNTKIAMRPFNCISDSCGTPNSTSVRIKSPFWSNKIFQKYAPVPLGTTSGNNRHSDKSCRPRLIFPHRRPNLEKASPSVRTGTGRGLFASSS